MQQYLKLCFGENGIIRSFFDVEGGKTIAKPKKAALINEEIRFPQVRLLNEDGEMMGIVSIDSAMNAAQNAGLDLVLIANNPDNPVCRIMDYGKYAFEQSKREREAKKNQKVTSIKEVQIKLTTDVHDFNVKVKNACRFLANEDRVKVVIRFRGREMSYQNQGIEVMNNFAAACEDYGRPERAPRQEGRNMIMFMAPLSEKEKRERQKAETKVEAENNEA